MAGGTHVKTPSDSIRLPAVSFLCHLHVVNGKGKSDLPQRRPRFTMLRFQRFRRSRRRWTQLNKGLWSKRFCVEWIFATRQYTALPGVGSLPRAYQLHRWKNSVLSPWRPFQTQLDLRRIQFQFGHDPAQRIAVDTKLSRSLALVAFIVAQYFLNVSPAKLADSLLVGDATGVHLYDKIIQFAFHL
jgi:hypothetical protein